jgi:hypothetical protein
MRALKNDIFGKTEKSVGECILGRIPPEKREDQINDSQNIGFSAEFAHDLLKEFREFIGLKESKTKVLNK